MGKENKKIIMDTILKHRSIRKYSDAIIEEEKLQAVLRAASRASTTGNMQLYSIIVTRDQTIKEKLWESHFKQDMVLEAPVHLTFCADFNRFSKWCKLRNANPGYDNFLSFFTGAIDALLAAQNAVIAAEYMNLGICYLGTVTWMADRFVEILKLPNLVVPVAALSIGYPAESTNLTSRLPLEGIIHMDTYKDYTDKDINSIYQGLEELQETLDIIKENGTENLARVFTDKRYTKKDNQAFSLKFLELIQKQGFMNNSE